MTASLDHLPEAKRAELDRLVSLIREGFAEAKKHRTQDRYRDGQLLKIVLFGSHARGDWVDDPVGRYFSDFDLLVVVDQQDLTDVPEFWLKTEDRMMALLIEGKELRTPFSLIYHSLDDVNEKLRLGRYFFIDILRDGVVLFEEPGHPFAEPLPLSPEEALKETEDFYSGWLENANGFLSVYKHAADNGDRKLAAFLLHQATESLYQCFFLVRTLYTPKTHNLNRLRSLAEDLEPSLKAVWPLANKTERQAYAKLRDAYIKARYSPQYRITREQLDWLGSRVEELRRLVREACEARIQDLARAA